MDVVKDGNPKSSAMHAYKDSSYQLDIYQKHEPLRLEA